MLLDKEGQKRVGEREGKKGKKERPLVVYKPDICQTFDLIFCVATN